MLIGNYIISKSIQQGKVHITKVDGDTREGGEFSEQELAQAIEKFYIEKF